MENNLNKKVVDEAINVMVNHLKDNFEEKSKLPNQYVVAYYKVSDDSLIGYHLQMDSFCQITQKIYSAKRYSGDNPYNQLKIIAQYYSNLKTEDVYLDAVYLDEDVPKQIFKYFIPK